MGDKRTWPLGDILPLVRVTPGELWPETGLLLSGPTVYLTDAFTPGLHERLKACGREQFHTFAEVLAAGWKVD